MSFHNKKAKNIVALRNEKGSYNEIYLPEPDSIIVALRNEKGSYNLGGQVAQGGGIVALRNEKGSYNSVGGHIVLQFYTLVF